MCDHQTLFHDDALGYVVRCNSCEKIQLGYGNLVITFSQPDFDCFRSRVNRMQPEQDRGMNPASRCIMIPTPCDGIKLLVSLRELDEFVEMLDTADNELQSLELLKLFN